MLNLILRRFPLLTALVHRDFRLYWSGHAVAVAGQQMAIVTQMWLIFDLTGSALQLGLLGLARAVPGIIMNLVGGVLADKLDQRKLLIGASTLTAALFATLATLTFSGTVEVWHVLAVVFGTGACEAFMQPSRQALFPNLIDRQHMMSAVGLNSAVHPGTRMFAPIIAGVLIDRVGMGMEGCGNRAIRHVGAHARLHPRPALCAGASHPPRSRGWRVPEPCGGTELCGEQPHLPAHHSDEFLQCLLRWRTHDPSSPYSPTSSSVRRRASRWRCYRQRAASAD